MTPNRRRQRSRLTVVPTMLTTFQEALAAVQRADPLCVTRAEWWERDYVALVLAHMGQLNAQQSPRATVGMIEDALKLAESLRPSVAVPSPKVIKAKKDTAMLQAIFGDVGLGEGHEA